MKKYSIYAIINIMKKIEFILAKDSDGVSYLEKYLDTLQDKQADKLLARIEAIENLGLEISIRQKYVKKIADNLFEIRSRVGNSQQRALYFQYIDNKYVITHGFTKKTQKTPKREITRAKSIRRKYLK